MLRRAAAHPRQARRHALQQEELRAERAALLRFVVSRPNALAEGCAVPSSLEELDTNGLLEALAAGEPLGADELAALMTGGPAPASEDPGVASVAAAVRDGLPGKDLAAAAYEVAVLHHGEAPPPADAAERAHLCHALRRAAGLSRREVAQLELMARHAANLERDFEEGDVPARSSLEYRLFLCRPEIASQALRSMATDELLTWLSRQLALVGVGLRDLLAVARRELPPPPPLAAAETPKLALPVDPLVAALDALLDVVRGWLDPAAASAAAAAAAQGDAGEDDEGAWIGGAPPPPVADSGEFPAAAYETAWAGAQEAVKCQVTDVMRGLGLVGERASLPFPGALSTQLATQLLSALLVVDPLPEAADEDEDSESSDEEDEETPRSDADTSDAETPTPRKRRAVTPAVALSLQEEEFARALRLEGPQACFAHDAARLWAGDGGVSSICSDSLRLSEVSQVAVLGASLLEDWEISRDDNVREGMCAVARSLAAARSKPLPSRPHNERASGGGGSARRWEWEISRERDFQISVLRRVGSIASSHIMDVLCPPGCDIQEMEMENFAPADIEWAVAMHLSLGSSLDAKSPRELFERLVGDVARRYYGGTIERLGLQSPLNPEGIHKGFGAVMAGVEDMIEFLSMHMLGPIFQEIIIEQAEAELQQEDGPAEQVERMFFESLSRALLKAYRSCTVLDDLAEHRPMKGSLDKHCKRALIILKDVSEYFAGVAPGSELILDHDAPSKSPLTQLVRDWLQDRQQIMMDGVEECVANDNWEPVAPRRPWSTSCRMVFEMLKKTIDMFFEFVPTTPAAMEFCVILLRYCCEAVNHYQSVVRQETIATADPKRRAGIDLSRVGSLGDALRQGEALLDLQRQQSGGVAGGLPSPPVIEAAGESSDLARQTSGSTDGSPVDMTPRLQLQTITTLHNLSECKGQFFQKMWLHFASEWGEWQKKAYADGTGTDEERARRKAAAKTVVHMRAEAVQNSELAIGATVRAVGQTVVFVQLRQCFLVDLYARKYWQVRREAQGARNKASAALRAARQQAKAEAPAEPEPEAAGSKMDSHAVVSSAKLELDHAEDALRAAQDGVGSLGDALRQGEALLDSSVGAEESEEEAGPVVAALAASLGSAALAAWERVVFEEKGRLYTMEAHEVLTADLNQLIRFLHATAKRQEAVGPMGREREGPEESLSPAVRTEGRTIGLTGMDERAVARLQGQMCLFGIDTHTLIEWYNGRISDPEKQIDGAPPEATAEVILKVLNRRDDTLAQESAKQAREGVLIPLPAEGRHAPGVPVRSASARLVDGWGAALQMMGGGQ